MNKNEVIVTGLRSLGFSVSEAKIYIELLKKPATHAQLSMATGINRTTLYRMVNKLEKRGLITHAVDDTGKFLVAADPSTLEADMITREEEIKNKRQVLNRLLPTLEDMKKGYESDFAVRLYEGTEGFKRMLWHELKTSTECLSICFGALEDCVPDRRWTEKYRQKVVEAGYRIREMSNPGTIPQQFTRNHQYLKDHYQPRNVSADILPIHHLTSTYNDTVAIYHVKDGRRAGLEITSKTHAQTTRAIFEQYWQLAIDPTETLGTTASNKYRPSNP